MKKLLSLSLVVTATLFVSAAFAAKPKGPFRLVQDQGALQPIPDAPPADAAVGTQPVPAQGNAVPLFECVKYRDECHIAPCAVPQIVMVKDPCFKCDPCNPCATANCVAVQICVPPCSPCPPKITCKRGGEYVKYDYGKYRVEITSRHGVVKVDYDS